MPSKSKHPSAAQQMAYNGTALQRERIRAYLLARAERGALADEIARDCGVPCVTKRISEMRRRDRLPIDARPELVPSPNGANERRRYFLLEPDRRQLCLPL